MANEGAMLGILLPRHYGNVVEMPVSLRLSTSIVTTSEPLYCI